MSQTPPNQTPPNKDLAQQVLDAELGFRRGDFRLAARLRIGPGQVLAVLGPNGAGKSTLLRLLAGLLALTDGSIRVGGHLWDDAAAGVFVPAVNRSVGLVFQDYRLFPHLSVLDNVAFGPRSRGAGRRRSRALAGPVIDRMGLGELAGRRPGQLSGGQAQRVALARALAAEPSMLLLDEPLAALDAGTRMEIRTELRRHLREFAGPSIVVTHDPLEALVLADEILVLEAGRIVQQGTAREVARRPATAYVARLMGLNLYHGVLADPATGRVDLASGGALFATYQRGGLTGEKSVARESGGGESSPSVLAVLAPSAIALHIGQPGQGSPRNVWSGTVTGVELLNDRVRISVAGPPDALVDVTPAALAELGLAAGGQVWLSAKATETIAYPA